MNDTATTGQKNFYDRWWKQFILLLTLTLLIRLILIFNATTCARDCIGFIRYSLNLVYPDQGKTIIDVLQAEAHPPGYPALISLTSAPFQFAKDLPTPDQMMLSAQLASALCITLLVGPLLFTARQIFEPRAAFYGTLLFLVLPVPVEITSDGLSEGLFLLMGFTAIGFTIFAWTTGRTGLFLPAGFAAGFAYLTRPEGLVLNLAIVITLLSSKSSRCRCWGWIVYSGLWFVIGWTIVATPYIAIIGGLTNKNAGKDLIRTMQGETVTPSWQSRPIEPETSLKGSLPIAAWWNEGLNRGDSKALWAAKSLFLEWWKAMHYLPAVFAFLGILFNWKAARHNLGLRLLFICFLCYAGMLWLLAYKVGYVSERHTIFITLLGCLFAGSAIRPFVEKTLPYFPYFGTNVNRYVTIWLSIMVMMSLPPVFKSMHHNRAGHCAAGRWLAQNAQPNEVIWDPFEWSDFYAKRTIYRIPDRNYTAHTTYVIVEPNNRNPHSRLPKYPIAQELMKSGEPVYHWPESATLEKAEVVVYRCRPLPKAIPIEP